jgi:transposase
MVFIKSFKKQSWLFPPDINDMIPDDHICYLVEEIVDKVDFSAFEIRYSGPGHPAYHPRVLVKTLIQAMLDRVRSSRAIARNIRENVVFMYLAEKLTPDFRTLSDFRKDNGTLLKEVFKLTVIIAKELDAIGLDHISVDGCKIKASASNNSTVTAEELDIIEEYVTQELQEGMEVDKVEDELFSNCRGYDQLNGNSRKKIKAVVAKYLKQMKQDKHNRISEITKTISYAQDEVEKNGLAKMSLTDPESRFMLNKKGRSELSYNVQITTDNLQRDPGENHHRFP